MANGLFTHLKCRTICICTLKYYKKVMLSSRRVQSITLNVERPNKSCILLLWLTEIAEAVLNFSKELNVIFHMYCMNQAKEMPNKLTHSTKIT